MKEVEERSGSVVELVSRAGRRGIRLWEESGQLKFKAPSGALTPDLRAALARHKAEVLEFLREVSGAAASLEGPGIEPVPREEELPLSFAQERMWLLERWEPDTATYSIYDALRLEGDLVAASAAQALGEIRRRHEALRSRFEAVSGRPRLHVDGWRRERLPRVDLRSLEPVHRETEAHRLVEREIARPFDLSRGPLVRVFLLHQGSTEHVLLLNLHHIVSDGWSTGVLVRELAGLYGAYRQGQPSPFEELAVQYVDYAAWQRDRLSGKVLDEELAWWRERLSGAPRTLDLPADHTRPAVRTTRGRTLRFTVPEALTPALRSFGRAEGATSYVVLLSAFAAFLHRMTGQADLVVGSPMAGRLRTEVEPLIGFFVNTLALRLDVSGEPTFRALVDRVRQGVVEAQGHQEVPFEKLVEELKPPRDLSRTPLFQVAFVVQNAPSSKLSAEGLTLERWPLPTETSKFDLTLTLTEEEGWWQGELEASRDLFEATTLERFARGWVRLLESGLAGPGEPVRELALLLDGERQALLREWNVRTEEVVSGRGLPAIFGEQARARPDAVAVTSEGVHLSYGELRRRARGLARDLRDSGVGRGDKVAVRMERGVELVTALLGVLEAGAAYVPLDPAYPRGRSRLILEDSAASAVVELERVAHAERWPEDEAWVPSGAGSEDLAYVIYTSGSTGRPKGVLVPHDRVERLFATCRADFGFGAEDVWTLFHSYAFDFSVWELWGPLLHGGRLVVVPYWVSRSPADFRELLAAERVTVLSQTPSAFRQLVGVDTQRGGVGLESLRWVVFGGEALEMESLRPWWQLHGEDSPRLVNMYGITETTVHVTHRPLSREDLERTSRIGRALGDLETLVLDRELEPVPLLATGEISVGGAGLAWGYLGRAAQTAERFVPHPFAEAPGERLYRSGDLARWRPSGDLEYQGRLDHQVKVRGFRIELGEIETALANHESVAEAVALARTDVSPGGQAELVGYVVPRDGGPEPSPAELREHLKARLPEQMVPGLYVVLDELPLTENGKVDRNALPVPERGTGSKAERTPPRTATERRLAEIWREVLGLDDVGVEEDFFDLGGHSLLATRLLGRVTESLGVELPLKALFQAPTISELSQSIEREREREDGQALPPLVPVDRDAPLPASFAQERMWLYERLHPGEPTYNTYRAGHTWGPLHPRAVEATYHGLLRRHEVLRTRLEEDDGRVIQVIEPVGQEPLGLVDLTRLPEEAGQKEARRLAFEDAERPLSLSRAPVSRTRLLRLGGEEHVFLLSIHHAAYDLWSGGVVLGELEELYRAATQGRPAELPELPVQYADVAAWQREWMTGEYLERELAWWRERLEGIVDSPMELPTDRPRPARETTRGRSLYPALSVAQRDGLWALARSQGVSPYMLLLAVFEAVLARWTGSRDVVVGSFVAHRNRPEMERVVGYLDNTVVLRTDATGDPSFEAFLRRVRETCLEAFAHPYLPYETLVAALAPRRDANFLGLFGVAFILELDYPAMEREIAGLQVRPYNTHSGTAKFDLGLGFREAPEGLAGELEYNVDLFDETTMWRLAEHLRQMVDGVLDDPGRPLSEMPYLTPGERHQVLYGAQDVPRPPAAAEIPVPRRILEQGRERPDAVAVVCEGRHLTYGELARRASGLAAELTRRGVGPETPVGIYLPRSAEAVWAIVGVMVSGACYVSLDPDYPEERLSYMLDEPGSAGLVTDRAGGERFGGSELWTVAVEEILGGEPPEALEIDPASRVYVIYTSGSTGRPKGVVNRHGSLSSFVAGYAAWMGHAPGERLLTLLSLAFDASVGGVFPTLCEGATLVLARETSGLSAQALTDLVEAEQVTLLDVPVNFWNHWVEELEALGRTGVAPALARVVSGGEPVYRERLESWRDVWAGDGVFVGAYGPTETTVAATLDATVGAAAVPEGRSRLPIGRVIPGVRAYALDLHGRPVGLGSVGEIHLGGGHVTRGYLNEPRSTADRFVPDPWAPGDGEPGARLYRTGDWGRRLGDGRLVFVERRDQQVKIRGYRIEPAEVEAALGTHPAVAVCAVRPWSRRGPAYLAAYVVAAPERKVDADDLRRRLEEHLPDYMVPAVFQELEALPFNPASGKVDYRALPEPDALTETSSYVAPRTATEDAVAEIFARVLDRPRVGSRDDFFRLGGHSLLATRLLSRLQRALDAELDLATLFADPTVEGVARRIEAARGASTTRASLPALEPQHRGATAPASFGQERLWLIHCLEPDGSSYNMPHDLVLEGELSPGALHQAATEVRRRHESLRTVFSEDDQGRPVQTVQPPEPAWLPRVDLSGLEPRQREAEAWHLARREALRPFALARGPVLRLALVRLSAVEHAFFATLHHIVSDGWSMAVFTDEVTRLYGDFLRGVPSGLAELPFQVADHALWQRSWLHGDVLEAELAHWREHLGGVPPALELPLDHPRPPTPTADGAWLARSLPRDLTAALHAVCAETGTTPFMALLASFQVLLHRLTGQRDYGVGTPVAGRNHPELEGLIGFFVNTLVLSADLGGRPSFRQLLDRCRRETLRAHAHQDLPFGKLVEALAPERQYGRTPLYQVMFLVQEMLLDDLEDLPGLAVRPLASTDAGTRPLEVTISRAAHVDWIFKVNEQPDRFEGLIEYSTDLFDATTIRRTLELWERLLAAAVAEPHRPVAELPVLSAAQRHQALWEWNDTASKEPERAASIPAALAARVREAPEAEALHLEDETWTYRRLDRASRRLAGRLRALGVGRGTPVAVSLERSPRAIAVLVAILRAGGAYVPLDPGYPGERLRYLLEDSRARVLVTTSELLETLPAGKLPTLCLDTPEEAPKAVGGAEPAEPEPALGPEDLAYVLYTSGSTGRPKGVAVPHGAVLRLVRGSRFADLGRERTWLQLAPMSFDASTLEIWGPLLNGGRLAIHPPGPVSVVDVAASVARHGVDSLWLTAALFHEAVDQAPDAWGGLRQLLAGGDVLSPSHCRQVLEASPGLVLINGYGPTENTTFTTCHPMAATRRVEEPVPLGTPVSGTTVYVVDAELGAAPMGVAGELVTGGRGLARGYGHRPARTAEVFVPNPFGEAGSRLYRTGDLARRRRDGLLEFLGRLDVQVKIRGFRVEPGEIEAVLREHPEVRDARVLARGEGGDKHLVGYVVGEVEPDDLEPYLEDRVPAHLVPAGFVVLDRFPVDPNGKVDRRALLELSPRRPAVEAYEEPVGPTEALVAAVFAEVLQLEGVGRHDGFFALGGHSLLASRVASRLSEAAGVQVPLTRIFEAPTVRELAAAVETSLGEEDGAPPPLAAGLAPDGPAPLSLAQQRLWFLDRLHPGSPTYNVPVALRRTGVEVKGASYRQVAAEIVRRHEPLRTRFSLSDDRPVQEILPAEAVRRRLWSTVDLSGLDRRDRQAEARRLAGRDSLRPFRLDRDPPLRLTLSRLGERDAMLLATLHHIAFDGWSFGILQRELETLDAAYGAGRPSPLPELPVRYADYAAWQRRWLDGGPLEARVAHRLARLEGAPRRLEMPTDRPRPEVWRSEGAGVELTLDADLESRLTALARRLDATPYMLLTAAYGALLARYAGAEDLLLGSPVAGRPRPEVEGLIGLFVNTLVLRLDLSGEPDFEELLERVRREALDVFAHQDVPFERLVDELEPRRDTGRNPLVQTTFAFQEPSSSTSGWELLDGGEESAKVDLALTLEPVGSSAGHRGSLVYATALFDDTSIRRLRDGFFRLLAAAADDPGAPVSRLSLVSPAERHQLLVEARPVDCGIEAGSLWELFEGQALQRPEAVALVEGSHHVTYGALLRRVRRGARGLVALGVRPGERLGLWIDRTVEGVRAVLSVLAAGAAYVPLDPSYPEERVAHVVDDAAPRLVLVPPWTSVRPPASEETDERWVGLETVDRRGIEADGGVLAVSRLSGEHPAYVIYTSGSTGRPKGVEVSHRHVLRLLAATDEDFAFGPDDVGTLFHSLAFDFSVWELWAALGYGGRLVLVSRDLSRSLDRFRDLLADEQVTVLSQTPSAFRQLAACDARHHGALPALRRVVFGGEALDVEGLRGWWQRHPEASPRLVNMYGITETTVHVTHRPLGPADLERPGSRVGRPLADLSVQVLDTGLRPVPYGVVGEIAVGGAGVTRGYVNRPALTAERFVPDPFSAEPGTRLYRSGDLARRRSDGDLEYLGRKDRQVQIRGFRVEPGDVEAALEACEPVEDGAVVVVDRGDGDLRLAAFVTPSLDASRVDEARRELERRLPAYMQPDRMFPLETLPLTAHGKLDRRRLASLAGERWSERAETGARVPPRDDLERVLAGIWEDLLGVEEISVTDGFFVLGGHSLLAVEAVLRMRRELDLDIPVTALFQHPTVRELARALGRTEAAWERRPLRVPLAAGGDAAPLVLVHPVGGNVACYGELVHRLPGSWPVHGLQAPEPDPTGAETLEDRAGRYVEALAPVLGPGPVGLVGWSLGGVFAFEMAHQLAARGEAVHLVLLDSRPPEALESLVQGGDAALLRAFAEDLGGLLDRSLDLPEAGLLDAADLFRHLRRELPDEVEAEDLETLYRMFRRHVELAAAYRPRPWPGRLGLVAAGRSDATGEAPDRGWGGLAEAVDVVEVDADHHDLLRPPAVETVARHLESFRRNRYNEAS